MTDPVTWVTAVQTPKQKFLLRLASQANVDHLHVIIMYIYHALINALSAHMIHINLSMIFYTHVEHSPTKTIYIKYYTKNKKCTTNTHTHTTVAETGH